MAAFHRLPFSNIRCFQNISTFVMAGMYECYPIIAVGVYFQVSKAAPQSKCNQKSVSKECEKRIDY